MPGFESPREPFDFAEGGSLEQPPFRVTGGERGETPVVFASPHSGRHYPTELIKAAALDRQSLRKSEDALVDQLVGCATDFGIPLISASYARAYIDLNRAPYELDQSMFEDQLPGYASVRTARVAAGLGSIARIVAEGQEIYSGKLLFSDALNRIERVHRPYHRALQELLGAASEKHGIGVLIDWHSMPSAAAGGGEGSADIVIGDRFGTSCAAEIADLIEHDLSGRGYVVTRNAPYAGGYTTEWYGRPTAGINALQIELNRRLYLDEETLTPNHGFPALAANIRLLVEGLARLDWRSLLKVPASA